MCVSFLQECSSLWTPVLCVPSAVEYWPGLLHWHSRSLHPHKWLAPSQAHVITHTHIHSHPLQVTSHKHLSTRVYSNIYPLHNHTLTSTLPYPHIHTCTGFMYGNVYDDEERFERQAVFPKLLAQHATDFSWVSTVLVLVECLLRLVSSEQDILQQRCCEGWNWEEVSGYTHTHSYPHPPIDTFPPHIHTGSSVTVYPHRLTATLWKCPSLVTPPLSQGQRSPPPTLKRPVS